MKDVILLTKKFLVSLLLYLLPVLFVGGILLLVGKLSPASVKSTKKGEHIQVVDN